jgi:hypothetical protein
MPVTRTYRFHEIFKEEVQAINQRRRQLHRGEVELELESRADTNPNSESDPAPASSGSLSPQDQADIRSDGEPILRPTLRSGLAGLALSGGGIRSASFCLGALQALDKACVLKKIDYLSTVSGGGSGWAAEIGSPWTLVSALVLIVLIVIAFCELQPLVLDGIFRSANRQGGILASFATWLQGLAALLAPFSAAVAFFSRHIGRLLRQGNERPNVGALASRAAGRAAVYIAGAAIPFLLWMAYLYLCFAIKDLDPDYVNWSGSYYHAPLWLSDILQHWFGYKTPIGWFYLVTGIELFLLSLFLAPNANSPHRLYRDRLSKAFLFDPTIIEARRSGPGSKLQSAPLSDPAAFERLKYGNFELAPLDRFKLSEISCVDTPFHLINTALNIQGSKYANRRGRNADFFVFSPKFIGSGATQYVRT